MTGDKRKLRYCAYVLRCWEERGEHEISPTLWRFSLQDARTGERHGFATLDALIAALEHELAAHHVSTGSTRPKSDVAQIGTLDDHS